jgi:hypothetical protein
VRAFAVEVVKPNVHVSFEEPAEAWRPDADTALTLLPEATRGLTSRDDEGGTDVASLVVASEKFPYP